MCIKRNKTKITVTEIGILFTIMACIMILLITFSDGIIGNDFWWHLKVGEWICENRKIPINAIFSWYGMEQQLPWTAHEWLSEVIYYIIFYYYGEKGIFWFSLGAAILMLFEAVNFSVSLGLKRPFDLN